MNKVTRNARITAAEATALVEQTLRKDEKALLQDCYNLIRRAAERKDSSVDVEYEIYSGPEFHEPVVRQLKRDGFAVEFLTPIDEMDMGERTLRISWPNVIYPFPEAE